MAINPETRYPGKITPASAEYPYGKARDVSVPGDGTGTPWQEDLVNDIFGFQQSLLSRAGLVPSGTPDEVGASQYLEALYSVAGAPQFESLSALVVQSDTTVDFAFVRAYSGGWAATVNGPIGGHYRHKTGATNAAPTVGLPVPVSTIGTDNQAAYCWDANGDEWAITNQPEGVYLGAFGVTGSGDEATEIQSAVSSGIRVLRVPAGTYTFGTTIAVASPITIIGEPGAKFKSNVAGSANGFNITSSDVSFIDVEIEGIGNSSYVSGNYLVFVSGVNNSPAAPTFINNIEFINCYIHDSGSAGIWMQYVDGFKINGCRIESCGREGVLGVSCKNGRVNQNRVDDVTPGDGFGDAYGVSFTKLSNPLTEDPISENITITSNVITNVTSWTGIDTHGGKYVTISDNTVTGCKLSIALVKADDGLGAEVAAASHCSVVGNTCNGLNQGPGIISTGSFADSLYAHSNTITGNTLEDCGDPTNALDGAINLDVTKNNTVTGNTILHAGNAGVAMGSNNYGFVVSSNAITDPYSNVLTTPRYVACRSTDNYGSITGNSFYREDPGYATYVGVRGVELGSSNNVVSASANYNEATNKNVIVSSGRFIYPPIVQSGTASGNASVAANQLDIAVVFPDAYTVAPRVSLSTNRDDANANSTNTVHVINVTTTGFTARISTADKANFDATYAYTVYWDAHGY